MICLVFFLALSGISSAAVNSPGGLTSIEWTSANSSDVIPNLAINFQDGRQFEAVLRRMDLYSQELRSTGLSSDHLCIFEGSLKNDLDSRILLTGGCPGENTFEITTTGKALGSLKLKVVAGVVTEIPSLNDEFQGRDRIDAIATTHAQRGSETSATRRIFSLPPAGFVLRLGIIYDASWLQTHGSHAESINVATRVVAQGQFFFNMPSLTVPVKLLIASIDYKNVQLTMGTGLDILIPFATDSSINTYVGMTTTDGGGIAYVGTICGEMKYRTALIGKPGDTSDALAGEVLGHELGHSLGAPHDFIEYTPKKTIRYDSTGKSCTDQNYLMDYDKTGVSGWSPCTVEAITANYNDVIAAQGKFCLALGCFSINFENVGTNIASFSGLPSAEECQKKCQANPNCEFFSFAKSGGCWLKRTVSSLSPRSGYTAGPKICMSCYGYSKDLYGNDIASIGNINSAVQCQQKCVENAQCNYFNYNSAARTCWLKTAGSVASDCPSCTSGPKYCDCFNNGFDFPGNDIFDNPNIDSPQTCQKLCQGQSTCKFFTYNSLSQTCYLKSAASKPTPYFAAVCGPQQCGCFSIDKDFFGNDIVNYQSIASAQGCQKLCLDNSACKFFTFNSLTQTCYLKNAAPSNPGTYVGAVSGPKICAT